MLRSQDGVETVEDSYENLKQGLVKIKTKKDTAPDLAQLVKTLEKEIGFEPVTEVSLELRGRLARGEGKLWFEVSETNQKFQVQQGAGPADRPPENQLLEGVAVLADPHFAGRIMLKEWKSAGATSDRSVAPLLGAATASVDLAISGMT